MYSRFGCAVLLMLSLMVQAGNEVKLTSLEWSPYSGVALPGQGLTVERVRQTLVSAGYHLTVSFYPWTRAITLAREPDSVYQGYFPEYLTDEIAGRCVLSDPVGSSPLGFIESVSKPVHWESLQDLRSLNIGVVQDYVNTTELDRMVAAGELKTTRVIRDASSIYMVAAGRLDTAIIDRNVFNHLLAGRDMEHLREQVRFHERLLDNKLLYVCFNPGQESLRDEFNAALKTLWPDGVPP